MPRKSAFYLHKCHHLAVFSSVSVSYRTYSPCFKRQMDGGFFVGPPPSSLGGQKSRQSDNFSHGVQRWAPVISSGLEANADWCDEWPAQKNVLAGRRAILKMSATWIVSVRLIGPVLSKHSHPLVQEGQTPTAGTKMWFTEGWEEAHFSHIESKVQAQRFDLFKF